MTRRDPNGVEPGDLIFAVADHEVDTRAELWRGLQASGEGFLHVQRLGVEFQRNISRDALESGELPPGVRVDDRPIGIGCQRDGAFLELKAVDLEALQHLVRSGPQSKGLLVFFERPSQEVELRYRTLPTHFQYPWLGLLLLIFGLHGYLIVRAASRATEGPALFEARMLGAQLALLSFAIALLGLRAQLVASPLFSLLGLLALIFVKPLNLGMHIRNRSEGQRDRMSIIITYAAPAIFAAQVLFHGAASLKLLWGGDLSPETEARLEVFEQVVWALVGIYILIDASCPSCVTTASSNKVWPLPRA